MSEQATGTAAEQATPAPAAIDQADYQEYRTRRQAGEQYAEPPAAPPPAAADGDQAGEQQPDPASEAGKQLAGKRRSLQSRIDELTAERGATARERDAIAAELARVRGELEQLRGGQPRSQVAEFQTYEEYVKALTDWIRGGQRRVEQPEPQPEVPQGKPRPQVAEFQTYEEYVEALTDWKLEAARAADRAEAERTARQRAQSEYEAQIYEARDRVEQAAKSAHPDFDTAIEAFAGAGHAFAPHVAEFILRHPEGHEAAYALAKDPELNARIGSMPAPLAYAELGAVVLAAVRGVKAAAPPVVSRAPEPVKPIGGGGSGNLAPLSEVSYQEYKRRRLAGER